MHQRKEGKHTAKNQILGISKGIRAKNTELSEHLKKNVDYDCLRNKLGKDLGLIDETQLNFCFITDFPLFEWDDDE